MKKNVNRRAIAQMVENARIEYFDETLSKTVVSILILLPSGTTKENAVERLILLIDVANAKIVCKSQCSFQKAVSAQIQPAHNIQFLVPDEFRQQ